MRIRHLLCFLFITLSIVACDKEDVVTSNDNDTTPVTYKPYKGCKVSIMGHSRCTYKGYIPSSNRTFYPKYDVNNVKLTWWWKLLNVMEAKLEVNESFSAGRVCNTHPTYPSYIDRVGNLGDPDVILFWGGINDQRKNTPLGTLDFSKPLEELDEGCFASAMDKLVRLMFEKYPKAEIIIFIEDSITDEGFIYVLRELATHYNLKTVDLSALMFSTGDGIQYNALGMQQIVDETVKQLGL